MQDLLFLAHRIPYPPDKGDKIRSWHIFEYLARRHRVHLGCFVDDDNDCQHQPMLRKMCASAHFARLDPMRARIMSLRGLFRGEPLSLAYYRDRGMARWVRGRLDGGGVARAFLFSSPMAQYVADYAGSLSVIMDFVDVDSDKWARFADGKRWPMSALYRRESRRLLAFERRVAATAETSLFVSSAEAGLFRELAPECAARVHHICNGVDFEFFSPDRDYDNPYVDQGPCLIFTGAMDYWANVDAVTWFAEEVFPAVQAVVPGVRFFIVGGKPTAAVRKLAVNPGVEVTGRVADVRPYVAHAAASVAPVRIARGVQNKVLEAMSMARAVIATPEAAEGIDVQPDEEILIAAGAADFATAVSGLILGKFEVDIGANARRRIISNYGWPTNLAALDAFFAISDKTPKNVGEG